MKIKLINDYVSKDNKSNMPRKVVVDHSINDNYKRNEGNIDIERKKKNI